MGTDLAIASNACLIATALLSLVAYLQFRCGVGRVTTGRESTDWAAKKLDTSIGLGLEVTMSDIRDEVRTRVAEALRMSLPTWAAFGAVGFALVGGILGVLSIAN